MTQEQIFEVLKKYPNKWFTVKELSKITKVKKYEIINKRTYKKIQRSRKSRE